MSSLILLFTGGWFFSLPRPQQSQVFTKSLEPRVLRQDDNGSNYSLALLVVSVGRQAQNANDMIAFIKSSFYECIISVIKTFTNIFYKAGRM